jgi:hypothetical protein
MIHTIPESKLKPLHDPNSTLDKAYFSSSKDSGLLPLVEIPSEVMEMVLKEGIPPLGKDIVTSMQFIGLKVLN